MVRILADTTSSIPCPYAASLGVDYLPQIIIFGDETYRDDTEIDTATFLQKLRSSSTLPKTAAPPPALYTAIFQEGTKNGDTFVVITPSADISGTTRSALVAAKDFPELDIRVIDTRTAASGLGSIVIQAVKWAREGMDADTLVAQVEKMAARERVYFVVDTLEYLYKGGRIGGAQAMLGSILQVKPILTLKDGRAAPVESQRTKRRALARIVEILKADCPRGPEAHLTIGQCDAEEEARAFSAELSQVLGISEIPVYQLPPAIVVHAGPKTISVSFFVAPG